jgi:CRISPR-associated protein Cas5t
MLGVHVTVPIACFRKGMAREYLETEPLPPPATCYGFLLALVGEVDRQRHSGVRVAPVLIGKPDRSVVLRTVWRVKKQPLGSPGNTRPDYQQLLTGVELVIWLDSAEEKLGTPSLEERVAQSLDPGRRSSVNRFGGLSLGESTHLVDQVRSFGGDRHREGRVFLLAPQGRLTLPVWVDHVGSVRTRFVTGDLETTTLEPPDVNRMPRIEPKETQR